METECPYCYETNDCDWDVEFIYCSHCNNLYDIRIIESGYSRDPIIEQMLQPGRE